ncbi:hypothetical protein WMF28_23530 [Sorangium sp. So ce590]|uniref:hypothetical protein n=1 Tax=Sorangium sp. So ce590 TaxID=3133317 RepID=UPI003F609710
MSLRPESVLSPFGGPPRQADLDALFSRASFGRVLARRPEPGRSVAPTLAWVDRAALAELRPLLQICDRAPPAERAWHEAPVIELFGRGERVATLTLHRGLALGYPGWNAAATLVRPEELAGWLAERGCPASPGATPGSGPESAAEEARWPEGAPPELAPLRGVLAAAAGGRFAGAIEALSALGQARPAPLDQATALLEWLGRDTGTWKAAPRRDPVPLALLRVLGDAVVDDAICAGLSSDPARRGAARFVAETIATRADQKRRSERLSGALPALREAARTSEIVGSSRAFEAALAPPPLAAPEGTRLLAAAQHGRLSRICRDGDHVDALDGLSITRFSAGAPEGEVLFALPGVQTPLFAREGRACFRLNGRVCEVSTPGGPLVATEPSLWSRIARSPLSYSVARSRWERARRRCAERVETQEQMPIFLEIDEEEEEAYVELGAAGAPLPRALATRALAWFAPEGNLVTWEGARAGSARLEGRPIDLAAGDDGLYVLVEHAPGEHAVLRIDGGAITTSARFQVEPCSIAHWRPTGEGVHLLLEAPLGDVLVDVARRKKA